MLIINIVLVLLFYTQFVQCKSKGLSLVATKIIQDSFEVIKNEFPEYVNLKVELINPGTENSYFNIEGIILKELPSEIEINLDVEKQNRKGKYEQTPFTIKKNYCTYMRMDKAIYPIFLKKGNFPSKCPVKPGKYVISNFTVTQKDLPVSVPVGIYKVIFSYNLNGKLIQTIWKGRSILI